MSLSEIWARLLKVKKLHLYAESLQPQQSVWRGNAQGQVVLSEINRESLIFSESGEWNFTEKPKVKFFNIYRWRLIKDEIIELSHLRNGINSPVHLVDFKENNDSEWHSEKPHVCREDLYAAILVVDNDTVRLRWTIDGPTKRQVVECIYE